MLSNCWFEEPHSAIGLPGRSSSSSLRRRIVFPVGDPVDSGYVKSFL